MSYKRETRTNRRTRADCRSCGWAGVGSTAQGRAAQHHDRTGHEVVVNVELNIVYGNREATLAAMGQEPLDGMGSIDTHHQEDRHA